MVIPRRVRVNDLDPIYTREFCEAGHVLRVIGLLNSSYFPVAGTKVPPTTAIRQLRLHKRHAQINQGARQVCQVSFAAAERRHGAYLQNFHSDIVAFP